MVMPDGFLDVHRAEITSLVARYRLPAVYPFRFFAELGALLSYGSEQRDQFRLAATYVDQVLKGATPSELPVQAPVKFERLSVPPMLIARADGTEYGAIWIKGRSRPDPLLWRYSLPRATGSVGAA